MHNRFGFSTKKADNKRPPAHHQFHSSSANPNRISSITPSLGAKPANQLFSLGKETTTFRHGLSTGKKRGNYAGSTGIPSTAMSTRAVPVSSMGFGSSRKSSVQSKLFGMTPQHSRAAFIQKNGASTSRRSSVSRGGKDNRPLSDPTFHRECVEKIAEFLTTNDYPQQIPKQSLLRPSMGDVSRIFEFLFSYFYPDIVIKNGPNTSLDVVVPKILAELGYPFQLKRSDLVSFSGGRQLGAILESICFVIDVIQYCNNVDVARFNKQEMEGEEFSNINTQVTEIALENVNSEDVDDAVKEKLNSLAEGFFGTEEQIAESEKNQEALSQNLKNLEEGIARNVELPKEIQALKQENENYDKYLEDVAAKEADHQKIILGLRSDIEEKRKVQEKVLKEKERLAALVDSQKEIIMQYQLSVERKSQIHEEMEAVKLQIQTLNENIIASTLEANKIKAQNSTFIGDLEDVISVFFNTIKTSKLNQLEPDFAKTFEEDKEWKEIEAELRQFRNWNIDVASDDLVREVNSFGQRFQNKFKHFKHRLLEKCSSLEGSASIELICKKRELQVQLERKQQELADSEAELKRLLAEKETKEQEEMAHLNQLNSEIDSARRNILNAEKEIANDKKLLQEMEEKVAQLQKSINTAQRQFMVQMAKQMMEDNQVLKAAWTKNEKLVEAAERSIADKENMLQALQQYRK